LTNLSKVMNLKYVSRTGWMLRGVPNALAETVASHTFEVSLIALIIAEEVSNSCGKVDVEKILKMSLIHDIPEAVMGDVVKWVKSRLGKDIESLELEALSELGLSKYAPLITELNKGESLEALIVKLADYTSTTLQSLKYFKAGYVEVKEISENNVKAIKELLSKDALKPCKEVLIKTLINLGLEDLSKS